MAQEWWSGSAVVKPTASGPLASPPKAEKETAAPSGFRWTPAGTLEPIPGGPADPATKPGGTEKPSQVPAAVATKAQGDVGNFVALQTAGDGFKDDYGGNPIGGLENFAQQYLDVGTPGQREWWAAFRATDNQIRNDLFGSALTAPEKAAYEATTIAPGMRPEIIRDNVTRRASIIKDALTRQREFMVKNGYKPEAVDALFAPILQQQEQLAAYAGQQEGPAPPALAGKPPEPSGQIAGVEMDNGGNPLEIASGGTRQIDNPALAGIRGEYRARLARGDSEEDILAWANSVGIHPGTHATIREQIRYRKANPKVPLEQYGTDELDDMLVPLSTADQAMNTLAQSPLGAGVIAAGDAASGFTLDNIIGATGGNAERSRLAMDVVADRNPVSSTIGTIGGGTLAALGLEGALAAKLGAGAATGLAADAGYGLAAGAGATDYNAQGGEASLSDRVLGGAKGAAAGVAGNFLGGKIASGMSGLARGVDNPSVRAVQAEGGPLTIGQQYGQSGRIGAAVKGVEDRLAGLPVVGDLINARRTEGLEAWNSKAFDRALKPIGGTVGEKVAEEAVAEASDQVSAAYQRALSGKAVKADAAFGTDLADASTKTMSIPRIGTEVADGVRDILAPYMQGLTLSGEAMQQISRELRAMKAGYRNDPLASRIGKSIDATEDAVFGMFKRQAPEVLKEYNAAKTAYRRLSVLEDSVLRGKNTGGVFTPGQLGMSDRASTQRFEGKKTAASGGGPFHDFQRAGQEVLPNKVPDSGTAGRILVPGALLAGGAGADSATGGTGAGLTLSAILAGAYTKAGQRLLTKPGRGMTGRTGKMLESEATRKLIRAGTASGAAAIATQ